MTERNDPKAGFRVEGLGYCSYEDLWALGILPTQFKEEHEDPSMSITLTDFLCVSVSLLGLSFLVARVRLVAGCSHRTCRLHAWIGFQFS